jgi:glycosyltransferase involved in cell wall biosynthesis
MNAPVDKPAISVIMPARNEGNRVLQSISSVVKGRSCRFPLQIVVIDDDSSDGCTASLQAHYVWPRDLVQIDVVRLSRWSGIPYARNIGAYRAGADILFITDANVIFPHSWDLHIWDQIGPRRVLCATIADIGSGFRGYGGTLHLPSMGFHWLRNPTAYRGYIPLSPCTGTVINRDLFLRIGGYDTAMPIYGAAEPEFSVRLWLSGAEIVSVPDLVLRHRFRPAAERRPFLDAIGRVLVHNYLRFGLLYLDQRRASQLFRYYAESAPEYFETAMRQVWNGDVWHRRNLLHQRLPVSFESFVRRFGLGDADGWLGVG